MRVTHEVLGAGAPVGRALDVEPERVVLNVVRLNEAHRLLHLGERVRHTDAYMWTEWAEIHTGPETDTTDM